MMTPWEVQNRWNGIASQEARSIQLVAPPPAAVQNSTSQLAYVAGGIGGVLTIHRECSMENSAQEGHGREHAHEMCTAWLWVGIIIPWQSTVSHSKSHGQGRSVDWSLRTSGAGKLTNLSRSHFIHTYIHTYLRTYVRTYIHTYMLTCLHACMQMSIYTHTHPYTDAYTHAHTHTHACMHTLIHTCIHTCSHAYVPVLMRA